jgi:uncharacterized protein (TIGR02001 family)
MKFKLLAITSLSLAALPSLAVVAQADGPAWGPFTANIGITSDYRFRGQQQGQGDIAVSGGLDYTGSDGLFAGVWASTVDFNDAAETYMELDLYAGYTMALDDKTSATLKAIYYAYPTADYPTGANHNDYFELIASASHDFGVASAGVEVAWSPDYFLESGTGVEVAGNVTVPITDKFWLFDGGVSASGHFGHQWIEDNSTFGTPDYSFYDIGVSAKVSRYTFDVRYIDTDLSDAECFGGTNLCEGGFVASLTIALP